MSQAVQNLSKILEYSLQKPNMTVELEKEIKNTKCYLDIQKYRFEGKFDVIWDYDEGVVQNKVVKLILQHWLKTAYSMA